MKDFRLISLTTLPYKLVAKVLAEQLKMVMDDYVPFLRCFYWRKTVLDSILTTNEVVEDYRAKRKK